jgi:hypothetical protein
MKAIRFSKTSFDITELHGVTTENTAHFIVTLATVLTSKGISSLVGCFPLNVVISGDM